MNGGVDVATFRSMWKFTNNAPVALSPDGTLAAYGTIPVQRKLPDSSSGILPSGAKNYVIGTRLWIVNLADGTTTALASGAESCWGPRWSPDGQWLAYYSDRNGLAQVWLWDRRTGETQTACDDAVCMTVEFEQLHWLPDSTHLVAKLRAPGWDPPQASEEEEPRSARDVWESPPPEVEQRTSDKEGWSWFDSSRGDLGVINIESGTARSLGTGFIPYRFAPSPDGRFVAAMCIAEYQEFDLHLFAVDGSSHDVLARGVPMSWGAFSWSPAGDAIAYSTYSEEGEPGQLVVVSLSGEQRVLHDGSDVSFASEEPYPPPLWSPDGDTVYCWANRSIYAVTLATGVMENITEGLKRHRFWGFISSLGNNTVNDGGKPGTFLVLASHWQSNRYGIFRIGNGQPEVVLPEQQRHLINLMLYGDSNREKIVGPIESGSHPADLFRIDIATGEEKRVTRLNPALEEVSWGSARLLEHKGVDDEALRGAVLLPAGYREGVRYPTILSLGLGTGGAGFVNYFEWDSLGFIELHAFTTRGYVVVEPGMPRRWPNVADEVTTLAQNALDAAVAAGYSDPERVGVMGHSRGGYSACSVITRTDSFRAAVAGAPVTNFTSFGLYVSGNEMGNWEQATGYVFHLRNTLWEAREQWVENSPALYCDQVNTPLLLLCGTADKDCMAQAEEMYGGLRQLGKRATLVRYHGEGHAVGLWSTENAQDCWDRIIGWFDRYVKGDGVD